MGEILSIGGITAIISVLVTLVLQFVPGLRVKWAGLSSAFKGLAILGMYVIVGAVVAFGGCVEFLKAIFSTLLCSDAPTFVNYVIAVLMAIAGGQGLFNLLPELADVSAAKEARE